MNGLKCVGGKVNVLLNMRKSRAKSLSDGNKDENRTMKHDEVTEKCFPDARNTPYFRELALSDLDGRLYFGYISRSRTGRA